MKRPTKRLTTNKELARKHPDRFRYTKPVEEVRLQQVTGVRLDGSRDVPWRWPEKLGGDESAKEALRVLVCLHHSGEQTKSAIEAAVGLRSYAALDRLVKRGLVQVNAAGRAARYRLADGLQAETKEQAEALVRSAKATD